MSLAHFFFFKQKTAYEMRISDWSSDVCSSDLHAATECSQGRATGAFSPQLIAIRRSAAAGSLHGDRLQTAQRPRPVGRQPRRGRVDRNVLSQPRMIEMIERIGRCMMDIEVAGRIQIGRASGRERVCQYV